MKSGFYSDILISGISKKHFLKAPYCACWQLFVIRKACIMEENEKKDLKKNNDRTSKFLGRMKQNLGLAFGLIFLTTGIILTAKYYSVAETVNLMRSSVFIFVGVLCLFFGLGFVHNSVMVFFGMMLLFLGVPVLLKNLEILDISYFQFIPYGMICAGVSLFLAGIYKAKKIRSSYIFPAIVLTALGVFFLLFATGVLHFSLTTFVSRWFPLLLLLFGVVLVVIFFVQQVMKKDFPYITEDGNEDLVDETKVSVDEK